MAKTISAAFILLLFGYTSLSQVPHLNTSQTGIQLPGLKLKNNPVKHPPVENSVYKKADLPLHLYLLGIAAIISPMAVFEDKKVFFALTKEISIGKYPYGRLSFEYSYVFRSYTNSHFRFSYNYDIFLEAGDFMAILVTPGAGYFTDTKNKGWFLHGSAGILLPLGEFFSFSPYFRYRHTFIKDELKTDIDDISLGVAVMFYR